MPGDLRVRAAEPAVVEYLDRLNQELLDRIQKGGGLFVSNAVVGGRYLLRACVVNLNTTTADIDDVPEIVARTGRATDAQLRPRTLGGAAEALRS